MTHLTNYELLAFMREPQPGRVADHIVSCPACAQRREQLQAFTATLTKPDVWEADDIAMAPTRRLGDLEELATTLAAEEEAATQAIRRAEVADLAALTSLRNIGGVRALHRAVITQRDQDPASALVLARIARRNAMAIPIDNYPSPLVAQSRAIAWKEEANLLRHQGDYTNAISALDHATACLASHPALAYDAALIDFVRGVTLVPMGRGGQALQILERASRTLEHHGDAVGQRHAELAIAFCHFEAGDYTTARSRWSNLLPSARTEHDEEALARLTCNIASCDAELGNLLASRRGYRDAITRFSALGLTIEIVRARWGLARLSMREYQYEDAMPLLHAVEYEFTTAELRGEACLVRLDIAECLLAIDRRTELALLLDALIRELHDYGASIATTTAIDYLKALHDQSALTMPGIAHVRAFLSHHHDPAQAYQPN